MKTIKKMLPFIGWFFLLTLVTFAISSMLIPEAEKIKKTTTDTKEEVKMDILRVSAVGDSLTEGIGDTTHTGGYVPLLQTDLSENYPIDVVQAENFGKSGDRSDQILKRIKKDEEMQNSIRKADVILVTVGGNDLMKVIQSKIFNKLTLKTFVKPREKYQKELEKMYQEIRQLNPDAPIYQLGIYNPFYKSFSEIKEMQEIVDYWNEGSKEFIDGLDNAYFVPINDEIYNGLPEVPTTSSSDATNNSKDVTINDLISEEDSFHPNNLGYQIIANAFRAKMDSTKDAWLK
ncbi:SGNH/GDSL hydrolase family protein [Vagococcus sp. DIV0080]|uniref:SGNH/GDSL hydrolase family protein n=1 Tax=Candidatus Vagococcus giribetii TaxID=2230876 RepID=A0ABS3HSW8_9ENTE|nr:SGNH/GDSL hydrolase family protein [Vagococcus sp. DIV0080]MBO0476851.1 SGNH/GDSL hydrolase family protein [Vagococcus sp. DIV0080]